MRSLLFHAVDPRLGGALLIGHRGCAKSTLARSFGALLSAVEGKPHGGALVEIPLGVSEDRLLGSVDAGALLGEGIWRAQTGLIEAADGGVLYVDEINLLPDALSDLLLDCAASGTYRMEREGLSRHVRSRFILVGTMNPEEGDLRPQLSDRFAHGVFVQSPGQIAQRMEIARRVLDFEEDPAAFCQHWAPQEQDLLTRLQTARNRLRQIQIPESIRLQVAERAHHLGVEGMRAEMAVLRTLRAATAWDDVAEPEPRHLEEAWLLCMGHRTATAPTAPPANPPPTAPSVPTSTPTPQEPTPPRPHSAAQPSTKSTAAPLLPADSHPDPLSLSRASSSETVPPEKLPQTERQFQKNAPSTHPRTPGQENGSGRKRTLWQASVVRSLLNGWKPGRPGWQWIQKCQQGSRRLWIFLDASRSTGSSRSLEAFRDRLLRILPKATRIRLLLLHGGKLRWLARDATSRRVAEKLNSLQNAAGVSPLDKAIRLLCRDMQRVEDHIQNTVTLCSDGLPQAIKGRTPLQTAQDLGTVLRRLSRRLPPGATRWIALPASRAQAGWLPKMLRNTGVVLWRENFSLIHR